MPTIDLASQRPNGDFCLRVVFDAPWDDAGRNIQTIQTRLYDAVEFALSEQMDARFPDAKGRKVVIRLDCYQNPPDSLADFFVRFIRHIRENDEWSVGSERLLFELKTEK